MKVKIYTKSGNVSEKSVDLDSSVWGVPMNRDLVAQVIHVYQNNQRKFTANVKTRGEVRGGGRKPWKQKHTGRARHGSIRSPIWVGGGVAFGPSGYKKVLKISRRMKNLSLKCLLSDKVKDKDIFVINDLGFDKPIKTKDMVALFNKLELGDKKVLVVYESELKEKNNLIKGLKNISKIKASDSKSVCSYEVINNQKLLITEKAVKEIESRLNEK